MSRCWASSLGDCSKRISGEHIFTAGLFEKDRLFVQGMNWCKTEVKRVGKKSLVKKVLCTTHNSRLSPLDNEAIRAFKIFQESMRLQDARSKIKSRYWNVQHWKINGPLLERWFLKTLITLACEGDQKIGPDSEELGQPSPSLVRIAYGQERFPGSAGLYVLAASGQQLKSEDRLEYMPMIHPDCLPGGLFLFRGYFFVLHLGSGGLDPNAQLMLPGPLPFGAMASGGVNVRPMLHLKAMKFAVQDRLSHVIHFEW